jgi:di/tricarboxylate transporter
MTAEAWFTVLLLLATVVALTFDLLPPALAVLGANILLLVTGVISTEESLSGFANPAPVTVAALFIVARAVDKTGALQPLMRRTLGNGGSDRRALARLLVPVAGASGFLNNTPIVAMLAPQVANWAEKNGRSASLYLMPLSFATILGGTITVIGTSTNLVVSGLLQAHGLPPLGMFELTAIGLPLAAAGLAGIIVLAPITLPARRTPRQEFSSNAREYVCQATVTAGGPIDGVTVEEARLRNLEGVFLVELQRGAEVVAPVTPASTLRGGDRLTFAGRVDLVRDIQATRGVETDGLKHAVHLNGPQHTFFEAVVGAASPLSGSTLKEIDFRSRYHAAVVAIHRAGERVNEKLGAVRLREGDTLLILADTGFGDRWRDHNDFLLVSHLGGAPRPGSRQAILVGAVTFAIIGLAGFGVLPILHAALLAAVGLVLAKVLSARGRRRSTSCARWRRSSSGRCCSSPAARTRSCWCGWRRRRSGRGRVSLPAAAHRHRPQLPETLEYRDWLAAETGAELVVRYVQDSIDQGRCVEETGPNASRNALQTVTLLDALARAEGRRGDRRRAPRRGEGARQGALLLAPRRVRPVGPEEPAAGAVEPLQRARARASTSASSRSATGRRWTSGSTSRRSGSRCRRSTSRTAARWWSAAACCWPTRPTSAAAGRAVSRSAGPLPHRRRRDVHGRRRVRRPPRWRRSSARSRPRA